MEEDAVVRVDEAFRAAVNRRASKDNLVAKWEQMAHLVGRWLSKRNVNIK
jgi:hypothetical protein